LFEASTSGLAHRSFSEGGNEFETGPTNKKILLLSFKYFMNFYKVSWEELEEDCLQLAKKLKGYKFDRILCISRGGLVWARMFSDLLDNLPISHLTIISYKTIHQQEDVKITELPTKDFKNETLLVVDEIADHGATFQKVRDYLKTLKIKKYYTLAPIIRSFTQPRPDFYLKIIDEWIIYPYEIKETYEAFLKIYRTKEKAKKMLLKYSFRKELLQNIS